MTIRAVIAMSLGLFAAACSQTASLTSPSSCRGEFRFDRIASDPLRRDALQTIVQFVSLDETVDVADPLPSGTGPLLIRGRGRSCDHFGRSFLASDMAEFQGLAYRRVQ